MKREILYAHSLTGVPKESWHLLADHLEGTARMASAFAASFGGEAWVYPVGRSHDIGKSSEEFQERLDRSGTMEAGRVGKRVDHSTAGARHLVTLFPIKGKLMAYAVVGHHGGLPDGRNSERRDLASRLDENRKIPDLPPVSLPRFLSEEKLVLPITCRKGRVGFQLSFFVRMIFSSLVDADFLDTERFIDPSRSALRAGEGSLGDFLSRLDSHLGGLGKDGPLDGLRQEILSLCRKKAESPPGFFTLNVPTGGGKTLSSLAFALTHAVSSGMDRVIYAIPFTSIIDQNALIFRDILGDDAVLMHHCSFNPRAVFGEDDEEGFMRHRLAAENWDRPVIVTTNVQLFESLFSSRVSVCRKLHRMAKSVIILDEAHMLPVPYLLPCLEALKELVLNYRCSVVICTATQPSLIASESFPHGLPGSGVTPIVEDPERYHTLFRRVVPVNDGAVTEEALAERVMKSDQVLVIVNTRNRAASLFERVKDAGDAFHLSARMCPVHRMEVITCIRERLKRRLPLRVVSTQLIEAGVDVDFDLVFREMAGLDSIIQAAGRCNREGRIRDARVRIFSFEDGGVPRLFRKVSEVTASIFRRFEDPFSPEAVKEYFSEIYWLSSTLLDEKGILPAFEEGARHFDFPFERVSREFRMIENDMEEVIIPYDRHGERLIEKLEEEKFPLSILRSLRPYTVSVYPEELGYLKGKGAISLCAGIYPCLSVLTPFYGKDLGLTTDRTPFLPEEFIF